MTELLSRKMLKTKVLESKFRHFLTDLKLDLELERSFQDQAKFFKKKPLFCVTELKRPKIFKLECSLDYVRELFIKVKFIF